MRAEQNDNIKASLNDKDNINDKVFTRVLHIKLRSSHSSRHNPSSDVHELLEPRSCPNPYPEHFLFAKNQPTSAFHLATNTPPATAKMCFYSRQMYYCHCPVAPLQLTMSCDNNRSGLPCRPDITYHYTMQYCNAHQYLDMFKDSSSEQPGPTGPLRQS